ncbi:CYFA0S10e01057g1_1 [Cyberlindnera fabianii]|uniref:CYFA0S10e01057g1_1 n=1 Tax=Cyberlindnera fabianii TaxID=36022 RepID=A0A061AYQ5_CYBFA|nr:CYFA0S10e01057g1_1 [Cyberlindnera fabianii]
MWPFDTSQLSSEFPHVEWATYVLIDAHATYETRKTSLETTSSELTSSQNPQQAPHADTFMEQLLGGVESHARYVLTSEPIQSIQEIVEDALYATSVVFATITLLMAIPSSITVFVLLRSLVQPILCVVTLMTPSLLFPVLDMLKMYQVLCALLVDLMLEAASEGLFLVMEPW